MDGLVHLSAWLPQALPQALAAGKPVVAFDCDRAREVCINGKTGYLVSGIWPDWLLFWGCYQSGGAENPVGRSGSTVCEEFPGRWFRIFIGFIRSFWPLKKSAGLSFQAVWLEVVFLVLGVFYNSDLLQGVFLDER